MSQLVDQTLKVLVEGYDENQVHEVELDNYDRDWEEVYRSRQNGTILQTEIIGIETKNIREKNIQCAVIYIGQVKGIIPLEFMNVENINQLRRMLGQKIAFKVIGIDQEAKIFIGSRKAAVEHMASSTWQKLELDQNVLAVVRSVGRNSILLDIGGITTRLEVEEYGYGWYDDLRDEVKEGDHLTVKVVKLDKEAQKVEVSRKATLPDPWSTVKTRFVEGGEYVGKVSGVVNYGCYVNLASGIDTLVPHMKFTRLQKGDKVLVRITGFVDEKRHITSKVVRKL